MRLRVSQVNRLSQLRLDLYAVAILPLLLTLTVSLPAQTLEMQLHSEPPGQLAAAARQSGDPERGAILFFQLHMACSKCHAAEDPHRALGPDLCRLEKSVTDTDLVESVLHPSKTIRRGFEAVAIVTTDGKTISGLIAAERDDGIVLRDPSQNGALVTIPHERIERLTKGPLSLMPAGQVNQLASRQQFLDLIRYLIEIREKGPLRAQELKPAASLIAATPLPEYEQHLDHAGLIRDWNGESLKRGEAIYQRVCANCHGTQDRPGSLPISPRFAEWKAKNGSDPFAMYQTLTHGFGFMVPQMWMVPRQKYDVIYYIRESYLRSHNPSQFRVVDDAYLTRLPPGNTRGPAPSSIEPWVAMDYGPSLINTYQVPDRLSPSVTRSTTSSAREPNLAYKGIAMRLDPGPGGVSRGQHWAIFDHDTLRMAAVWSGQGFIDWRGIHFNGEHQVHPTIVGQVHAANPVGPGWANPANGSFEDPRLRGRDGRPYGPLPRTWSKFRGLYAHGQHTVVSYTVGTAAVLECVTHAPLAPESPAGNTEHFFTRTLHIGPREQSLTLLVATMTGAELRPLGGTLPAPQSEPPAVVFILGSDSGKSQSAKKNRSESSARCLAAGVTPNLPGGRWRTDDTGRLLLDVPPGKEPLQFQVWTSHLPNEAAAAEVARAAPSWIEPLELESLTRGGPRRWPQTITTEIVNGRSDGPFAVDVLTPPDNNPWLAQTRLTGFDFDENGDRAAVCSWDGDVWLVTGLASSAKLTWQRIASGLFQPLGLKIIGGTIHVTCRDQIVRLHDLNRDGETDFYECFNNDHQVTEHFHEFAMGLQVDASGNLYYAKSARHALPAVVPHHGTLLRVSPDGSRTDILANGFRAANGVCLNPDGSFIVTDQEGHWNPKNRINWVTANASGRPKFYGNMFGFHDITDSADSAMEQPLCWITNAMDRSPAELLWVTGDRWGPLRGKLLNLSYGYGKIFVVPHEDVPASGGAVDIQTSKLTKQGGVVELPIPKFPTGILRGRFHPQDGQLYVCGMFAWAGNATQPGGFYRVRATGQPLHVPIGLHATRRGLQLQFTSELAADSVTDTSAFAVKVWSLKRSADYGSKHDDERSLSITSAKLAADRRTVELTVPDIAPTWCMEIRYALRSADGQPVNGTLHNTIHRLASVP